jgi:hypothetical protein
MTRPQKARLGLPGYVALLAEFKREPADITSIFTRTNLGKDTTYRLVTELHAKRLLHVSSWLVRPGVVAVPIYAYGPGDDAAPPATRPNGRPIKARLLVRARVGSEIIALAALFDALTTPIAIYELRDETGLHRDTIGAFLRAMRAHGLARIARWQPRDCGGGQYLGMWTLGEGNDAAYPSIRSARRKNCRAWRQRTAAAQPILQLRAALAPANDDMRSAA